MEKKFVELTGVVKCTLYRIGQFVSFEDCEKCHHHKKTEIIHEPANGSPGVIDIICTLPVRKRVDYLVKEA